MKNQILALLIRNKPARSWAWRRGRKERRLHQVLADADLKRFFRAIQDCGDVEHEILLKLLFYTAVRVSELVHIEVGDVDLDACKILINRGKGAKDRYILFPASFRLVLTVHIHPSFSEAGIARSIGASFFRARPSIIVTTSSSASSPKRRVSTRLPS